jgi:opacity protein-like surface antigen
MNNRISRSLQRSLVAVSTLIGLATIPAVCIAAPATPGAAYMSVFLGASAPQDASVTITEFNPIATKNARIEFDPNINFGFTGGYNFGFLRLEGEMTYKRGDITKVTEQAYGIRYVNVDGHIEAFALMVNGFFDLHNESPVTPYIGGGMGGCSLRLNNTRGVDANTGALNTHIFLTDEDTVFAYQVGTGLEIVFNPRLSLDLGYRYFGTSKGSFRKDWPNSTDLNLESHNAAVGLRVKF